MTIMGAYQAGLVVRLGALRRELEAETAQGLTGNEKAKRLIEELVDLALGLDRVATSKVDAFVPEESPAIFAHSGRNAVTAELSSEDSKSSNPKDSISTNKLPSHLVSPIVKAYQAISHFLGNVKYGAWNYRGAGARASVYRAALDRHVDAWWEGEELDPIDGTPHLANALACLGILIDAKHAGKLIDDRPPSLGSELQRVRADFEDLMPKIREKYRDKNPKHYTVDDTEV